MHDVTPSDDSKGGATPSGEAPSSSEPPPPSSSRGFIGTNTDAAQAYVPPTPLPETPEPPVPARKVALSDAVDPRKAPTNPKMKADARSIAAELFPPEMEAPPDSQSSGIRRGTGYAPTRSSFPPPLAGAARAEAGPRAGGRGSRSDRPDAVAKPAVRVLPSLAPPASASGPETPAQRGAALMMILLFAAMLALAVVFFLRRAPPMSGGPAPSMGGGRAPAATAEPGALAEPAEPAAPATAGHRDGQSSRSP